MVASLLQLKSKGLQDAYLTESPEINLFKFTYKRYLNFATELVQVNFNESFEFGKSTSCTIPNKGHYLSKMYLKVKLPALTKNGGTFLSWTDTIGYAMFEGRITLEINGVDMDYFYPDFANMYEAFTNSDLDLGCNQRVLRSDAYVSSRSNALTDTVLMIPLKFWFNDQYNLSLPTSTLNYPTIRVKCKLKDFQDLVNYDGSQPSEYSILDANLMVEYIFLDDSILEELQKHTFTQIISQVSYAGNEFIPSNSRTHNTVLHFNNPCKELVFAFVEETSKNNNDYYNFNNTVTNKNLLESFQLILDGHNVMDEYIPESFGRMGYPSLIHKFIPVKYVYTMPFCILGNNQQPTGSLNLSNFDNILLSFKMTQNAPSCYVHIFSIAINVITIKDNQIRMEFMR
jgi:glutaredoxin-related protein